MRMKRIRIEGIPAALWGEGKKDVIIAIHGRMGNKEEEGIEQLAQIAVEKGYQVLSFDLPCHGERYIPGYDCDVKEAVEDLHKLMEYAKANYESISLYACSLGAYFAMIGYKEEKLKQCLFISPIVDMKLLIEDMMEQSHVTIGQLEREKRIEQEYGQPLDIDYYTYVCEHPIDRWEKKTEILYGEQDQLTCLKTMKDFSKKFNIGLTILFGSEHYLHTEEENREIKKWIENALI